MLNHKLRICGQQVRRSLALLLIILLSLSLNGGVEPPRTARAAALVGRAGAQFVGPDGRPFFVWAVNYEGPRERAWRLWEDGQFDPSLIEADLSLAERAGLNTVRVFVQPTLRDAVLAGDYRKLDTFFAIAARHHLYVLLTLYDYDEPDLGKAADVATRIASHLAGEPALLGYDLKNEPQFADLATATYPALPPLEQDSLIAQYGEQMNQLAVDAWRLAAGASVIPSRLDQHQGYIYANLYLLYRQFLNQSGGWVLAHPGSTILDYMAAPDAGYWQPFIHATSDTLAAWLDPQIAAVRNADASHLLTVGYNNAFLAKLDANQQLDFQAIHRFPGLSLTDLNSAFSVLAGLKQSLPDHPILLEEFGYPDQPPGGQPLDPNVGAAYEAAIWLRLYSEGYAGGGKWMLNNFPLGYNAVENSYGLLDDAGEPKASYQVLRALTAADSDGALSGGSLSAAQPGDANSLIYSYTAPHAFFSNAPSYTVGAVQWAAAAPAHLFIWWGGDADTRLHLVSVGAVGPVTIDSAMLLGKTAGPFNWSGSDAGVANPQPLTSQVGPLLTLTPTPLTYYTAVAPPPALAAAPPRPDATYFPLTGHNLGGAFRDYWRTHGGLATFGYPLSEEFSEGGYTVQYFERARFEYHPQNQDSPYAVLLGRLGADLTAGRQFDPGSPVPDDAAHLYFTQTQHQLAHGFLSYWQTRGGLAQFGYPISEELTEVSAVDGKTYTVQYFERARFEYHPELPPGYQVSLGLLGRDLLRAKDWLR